MSEKTVFLKDRPVSERTTQEQVLRDIEELVGGLIEKITQNVDECDEKASFTIRCELKPEKEGGHTFEVSGKTSLNTPKIIRGAKIQDHQLQLFGT